MIEPAKLSNCNRHWLGEMAGNACIAKSFWANEFVAFVAVSPSGEIVTRAVDCFQPFCCGLKSFLA
jgi:hypothetical protein